MIKVLIVDDEMMFRIGVKSCIDWNEYGYELVGEAANGKQALEMVGEFMPDIVFTDIKMPEMDGLELTRNIIKDFCGIRVIILSCYNDFEYVKEALKLGASDYILKLSMRPDDLIELLLKMRGTINEEKQRLQQESEFRQEYVSNIHKLKEEFLKGLIYGEYLLNDEEFEKKVRNLGLKLRFNNNRMIIIKIDDYANALKVIKDEALFQFAFVNISNEILNRDFCGEVVPIQNGVFACIISMNDSSEEAAERISQLIQDINSSTKKYLNYSVSAGVSQNCGDITQIRQIFEEASDALDMVFYGGKEFLGFYRVEKEILNASITVDLETESKFIEALESDNREAAFAILNQICRNIDSKFLPSVVRAIFKEIVYILNRAVKRFGGNLFEYADEDPIKKIDGMDYLESIKLWMNDFLDYTLEYIRKLRGSTFRNEIMKVLDHIKLNIAGNISLKEAAQIAHISEKYFCFLFKKETGKNYIDYINDLKVERAKELLKNREIKSYEVAQQLGFENESYFSKIFKRYSGFSPHEYRRIYFP